MFDDLMEKLRNAFKSRLMPLTLIYVLLIFLLLYRLFSLQIVKGDEYESSFTNTSSKERVIQATRGNIYDVNGTLLAYSELAYNVTFLDTGEYSSSQVLNEKIAQIIDIIESTGGEIDNDDFGLSINKKGKVTFTGSDNEVLRFKRDVYACKKVSDLTEEQKNATAEEVFAYLRYDKSVNSLKFLISDEYSKQEAYKIMAIRYAMYLNSYYKYNPLVIATNVSDETVAAVKEYSGDISGLDIESTTIRKYNEKYAYSMAHILGYTGKISEEAYEEKKESGYSETDQVGKTGIEQQYEDKLHGKNGYETVYLDSSRRIVSVKEGEAATPGEDVTLSINADLQNVVYEMTEKKLAGIVLANMRQGSQTSEVSNGDTQIVIPQNAVFYALIKNGVIDVEHFSDADATDTEKEVYEVFSEQNKVILDKIARILSYSNPTQYKNLSDDERDYLDYIYKMLVNNKVLLSSEFNSSDVKEYDDYLDGKLSLSEFLQYALSQDNWVDRTVFSDADQFYDSKEIYEELLKYLIDELSADEGFSKMVYKTLIYSNKSGAQISKSKICLLLFDQNVIDYNKEDYQKLKSGSMSPYSFIRSKINKLEITPGQLGLDPCSGSVIVTDPNTGKIQAMVSYPGYDNNLLANKIDSKYYSYLTNNASYPLINRPIQQKSAPGSTFKMISSIAALEEPGSTFTVSRQVNDTGKFTVITPSPSCWKKSGHGLVNVTRALEVSCNVYYYTVGYEMGKMGNSKYVDSQAIKIITKYASQFGFGELSGVELPNEAVSQISTSMGIPTYIGQGTNNFTPISLAKYIGGLANRGTVYDLSIIKDSKSKEYNTVKASSTTWNAVSQGNKGVVNGSESSIKDSFKDVKVTVAGKTGTAQESKKRPNHAFFVSYAPFDNPEVTVTAAIPNGYTSHNAAELAAEIYEYYFADDKGKEEIVSKGVEKPGDSTTSNE